jgi:hypothetical protein
MDYWSDAGWMVRLTRLGIVNKRPAIDAAKSNGSNAVLNRDLMKIVSLGRLPVA